MKYCGTNQLRNKMFAWLPHKELSHIGKQAATHAEFDSHVLCASAARLLSSSAGYKKNGLKAMNSFLLRVEIAVQSHS